MIKLIVLPFVWVMSLVINLLSRIVHVDGDLILFGALGGKEYADNSRCVYEWVLLNRKDWKAVWMTRDRRLLRQLRTDRKPVVYMLSVKACFLLAKARLGVYTHSLRDLAFSPRMITKRLKLVVLRHGKSVKRVRFARLAHKMSAKEAVEREKESKQVQFVISTSEFISDLQEECVKMGRAKHVVTGYPRNDLLIEPNDEMKSRWQLFLKEQQFDRVILYGPSWRHGREETRFFPFSDMNREKLLAFLQDRNILLLLRPHLNDLRMYAQQVLFLETLTHGNRHVRMAAHTDFPDANMLLPFVDILVSDYSALYHDFLLLDRPMLFVPYDYDDYAKANGFLYDYYKNLPGTAVSTFSDFCRQIDQLVGKIDEGKEKRRVLLDLVHTYRDAKSSERVALKIEEEIVKGER